MELRREVSNLEQSVQSADAASTHAKFHESGLQQEIESLKRHNDWLEKELKTKSEEYTKYRKDKSLRAAELQRQYDEAQSTLDAAKRIEANLRRRLDEVSQKADESFTRIQEMQEEAAHKDEAFRVELDAANRLIELTRNAANTERQRQQDLFAQLETSKEDASEQLGRLAAELESEHRDRQAADAKIAELEDQIEQLQADLLRSQSRPSAHNQGMNGYATPTRGISTPMGSPGTPRPKGGLSITQMYSSYNELKAENEFEKRRNQKLTSTLDDMIQDLETRQPEIEELRADHNRLELEIAEMSSLVDLVGKERDQALRSAKKWEGQMEAKVKEGEVLRQQLRDLSSQVKVFLMEVHLRDQGHNDLSVEARVQLERLAQGQVDGEVAEGMTDTDRFISENLVTFRTMDELQEQNMNLLRITRELGEKMEHEESVRKRLEETRDWDDLQQKYGRCKDEIKSLMTQSQSYIRERDMFRSMLAHRGQLPHGTTANSLLDTSINGHTPTTSPGQGEVINSIEDSHLTKELADYAKLYHDMQAHFDAYRNEAATDRSTLKEQVDSLSKLNGELRSEVIRGNSQATLAHERYEMLQANYSMLRTENAELQKRSQSLSDGAAKQELRVQHVAEDLVEAKGLVDSMRNENAHLKASKDFWKTVEKRLTEDNENLLNERNRLNILNANLQNVLNERERSENETRQKLQTQVDSLEKDLRNTKNKLAEEIENNKRASQRREYDNEQSQKRINDLVSSLGNVREQLVAANVTKDHLLSRVEELTIELRSAEERVNVLGKTSDARLRVNDNETQDTTAEGDESTITNEQKLAAQATDLKRDLDLTKAELDNVKGQVEQYKAISQASEDELQSLNETHDLYRHETDKFSKEKDLKISELEQRIEDTTSELASTTSELSALRNDQAENGRRLEDRRRAYEAEIAQIKDQDDRHAAAAQYYQEDLKIQADIAQQAQQNYENELVKHADAAKALQKIRADYNDLKLEIVEVKTEADSARTSLAQSEDSWKEARDRYERELAELKAGRENLRSQNDRLHQQLENVTAQISNLKKCVSSDDGVLNEELPQSGLDNLQEVIKYLRREKEIVDIQLELSTQEAKRLKQQLDYTQSQLDDTRMRLNQRRRVEDDSERSSLDHNKLAETINELNTFRESNVTLRAETRQAQSTLAARTTEVEELKTRLEPLQAEILELKNELETQAGEMKLLKENSDRWQQRAQNVLQKYNRVDPADLEVMNEKLKTLEAERDELNAMKQSLQERVDASSAQVSQVQEQSNEKLETMRTRLTDQFKARSKIQTDKIKEKDAALQTATNEKQHLEHQLSELSQVQANLESARAERDAAVDKAGTQVPATEQNTHIGSEDGQVDEDENSWPTKADFQSLRERVLAAEARAEEESSQSANLQSQLEESRSRTAELELQIVSSVEALNSNFSLIEMQKQKQKSIDTLQAELSSLRATQQVANDTPHNQVEQQLETLRRNLAQAQQEANELRTNTFINASLADVSPEDGSRTVANQVEGHVAAVRAELETRHDERVKEADETLEKRTNIMKAQLSKKLTEGKAQIRQSLLLEHEETVQKLKTEHEQELEKLARRHKDELDELRQNEDARFAKFREAWEKGGQGPANSDASSEVKVKSESPSGSWQPSETEARAFLQSNEIARSILKKNIITQVSKAKEEMSAQLKEEHEKAMIEVQNKASTAKEHAVMMEGKKTALQVNMANNKARISQFKIGIVEKAAQETPQKPVEEVWAVAKDAKPPPAATSQPQQGSTRAQQTPGVATFGQPTQSAQNAQQKPAATSSGQASSFAQNAAMGQQKSASSIFGQPALFSQTAANTQSQPIQTNQSVQQPNMPTFGRPSPAPISDDVPLPSEQGSSAQHPPTQDQALSDTTENKQHVPPTQSQSASKQNSSQNTSNHHPTAGTGPGAIRGLQQSGLPVARGGSIRGHANARGRGSGIGRGGPQGSNTNQSQQGGRASPGNGGISQGAKQFVPGNKRPRDDEQQGADTGVGKRIRGGGGA